MKILQQSHSANIIPLSASTNTIPSQQLAAQLGDKPSTKQWNANGIHPKLLELHDILINSDINIVGIQGSKLHKADKTPLIECYSTIRKDRNNILGGGLPFFVRKNVIFKKIHSFEQTGMKILSVRVRTSKSLWIKVYNIYLQNTTTQQTRFDPNLISPSPH